MVYRRSMKTSSTAFPLTERRIVAEGIRRPDMRALVVEHFEEMIATAAPESSHALELADFADPAITLYAMRAGDRLLGCGALKVLGPGEGEVKTMRTVEDARGLGIGGSILDKLIQEAVRRGYHTLYLETGSEDFFRPARAMYTSRNFVECGPFGDYVPDAHSVFMALDLRPLRAVRLENLHE